MKIKELSCKRGKTVKRGSDFFRSEITLLGHLSDAESQDLDIIKKKYKAMEKLAKGLIK